jgi:hypothetical protein
MKYCRLVSMVFEKLGDDEGLFGVAHNGFTDLF